MNQAKYELFFWTSLATLIVASCVSVVPWWSTAGMAIALAVLLRIWVWALRHNLRQFHQRYTMAADTIRESCAPDVVREWKFHDDEIEQSYRFDDDDDDDDDDEGEGDRAHVEPQPA